MSFCDFYVTIFDIMNYYRVSIIMAKKQILLDRDHIKASGGAK